MSPEPKKMSRAAFVANMVATALFFPALILLLAGHWRWVEGWILGLWLSAMIMFSTAYLYWKNPALLAERARRPGSAENQKQWDRYLLPAIFATAVVWLLVLPLDAGRFHWSPTFPLGLKIIGALALVPAFYLIQAATIQNTYLSTMVRIQTERKQQVVSTGVYGFVRHPLYLGCMLMMLGAPLLVGSLYALIISLVGSIVLAGRILGEERMLVDELEGYDAYKKRVKYRLIPFVW
jgi:protein-S-isoprenylcysteine O-methyltransferase Ste14